MAVRRIKKNVASIISAIRTIMLNAFESGKIKRTKNRKITSSEHEIQITSRRASIIQVYCCKSLSVNFLIYAIVKHFVWISKYSLIFVIFVWILREQWGSIVTEK